jgi:hypothetical protein
MAVASIFVEFSARDKMPDKSPASARRGGSIYPEVDAALRVIA